MCTRNGDQPLRHIVVVTNSVDRDQIQNKNTKKGVQPTRTVERPLIRRVFLRRPEDIFQVRTE